MKLYEITNEMIEAIEQYNSVESNEDLEALGKTLQDIQISFNEKAIAVAFHIRNIEADVNAIDLELERLKNLKAKAEREIDWFKNYLHTAMAQTNTPKVTTATMKLALVKNPPAVTIVDMGLIPEEYKRAVTTIHVDKQKILDQWKASGIGVEGTIVNQAERLSIK